MSYTASSDAATPAPGPKPAESPQAAGHAESLSERISPERRRITYALLLSLLIHTLLFSLTFRGQGHWLLWLAFPWQDRRIEAPDLRVTLVPAPVTAAEPAVTPVAEPSQQAKDELPPVTRGPRLTQPVSRAPTTVRLAKAVGPEASPKAEVEPKTAATAPAATARPRSPTDLSRNAAPPPSPAPAVIAVEPIDEDTWVVPAAPVMQTPALATAPSASIPETEVTSPPDAGDARAQIDKEAPKAPIDLGKVDRSKQEEQRQAEQLEAARKEAAHEEATRAENARLETERQTAARIEAARAEAERQEAVRLAAQQQAQRQETARREEAARVEAARQEAQRQEVARREEAARVETARQEAQRQEVARREEAARVETARREAERQEVARREEAARVEAARQEAQRQEAARSEAAQRETERQEAARARAEQEAAEARREARLRAIGRQLDDEAARREELSNAARVSPTLPLSLSTARRVRLWGRVDPNVELIRYAEAWEKKIQLNTPVDTVREMAKRLRTNPMLTVAIRSDGSVESVTFVHSSGTVEVDDAIRTIVKSNEHYQAFSPALARDFDVIEIRRTWYFDAAVQFY